MSNAARAAPSGARRAQYRPRAEREDGKKKGKGPRNITLSQNVSEASTSQSPALRAVQGHSTRGRRAPTHFLSLPLGHHPEVATRISAFTDSLLSQTPAITGLDSSIVVSPARLHLTLGVMHLVEKPRESQPPTQAQSDNGTTEGRIFTVREAIDLLHSLREPVRSLLNAQGGDGTLRVPFNYAGVLQVERRQKGSSNVFWVGPSPDLVKRAGTLEHTLQEVGRLVNAEFRKAGFITEKRPLELHCTLINTKYRKPRPKQRYPFSHEELFSSSTFASHASRQDSQPTISRSAGAPATSQQANVTGTPLAAQATTSHPAEMMGSGAPKGVIQDQKSDEEDNEALASIASHPDFGTWTVQEIQLCQMRGKDRNTGAYISVGSIELVD